MSLIDKAAVAVVKAAEDTGAGKALLASAQEAAFPVIEKTATGLGSGQISQFIRQKLNMKTMSSSKPLDELSVDAEKAYGNNDWSAAKRLYQSVLEETKDEAGLYGKNYVATGRLARANFYLGNHREAEHGFRKFLSMGAEPTQLRGNVYNELADILEHTRRGSRAGLLRSHAAGNLAEKPDFTSLSSPLKVPESYEFSDEGMRQAQELYEYEMLKEPLAKGFLDFGQPLFLGPSIDVTRLPLMSVIDHEADPALKLAADAVERNFGHLKNEPAHYATALTEYAGKLFRPTGRDWSRVEQKYNEFYGENVGQRYFFGEYLRQGFGVCNQRALFIKTMADKAGLESTFYRGYVNRELTGHASVAHDFPTIVINGKEKVYDAAVKVIGENFSRHSGSGYTSLSIDGTWIAP